jgi:hypothetical protein
LTDFERGARGPDGEVREPRKSTLLALKAALETGGVIFIGENGGGPGVRLRERQE